MSRESAVREEDGVGEGLTREEVVARLCRLLSEVQGRLGWLRACDCFCGYNADSGVVDSYRNDGEALRYVEDIVRAAINPGAADASPKGDE